MNVNFAQLVKKAKVGDQNAMTDLYAETSQQVYFAALKLVGNQPDAEDIASETYVTAFSNLEKLAEPAAFPKWVRIIAVNLAKDFLKKKKPVIFDTDEEEQRVLGSVPEESEDCLPEVFAERRDLRRQVVELIDALPEAQRATVYLHYMEGHSVEEVAEIMEVNENTVKSRLNYARSKLRKLAERSGLTLGAVSVITLVLREECKATAVPFAVNKAVTGFIGSAGAAIAATGAATAGAAAAGTTAKVGLAAKIASMGIGTKIAAVVAAGAVLIGGGIGISSALKDNGAEEQIENQNAYFAEIVEDHGGLGSFIGMTGEDIIEVFGDEFDYTQREEAIDYHLDNTVGFMFIGNIEEGAPCTSIYTFSAEVTIPGLYGADKEGVLKFISDNGYTWSEGEPAEFDNAYGVGGERSQFIIFIYDGNIRYAAISNEEGLVNNISITDYKFYDQQLNGNMDDVPTGTTDSEYPFTILDECDPVGMLGLTVDELYNIYGETFVSEDGTYVQYEYNGEHLCCTIENGIITRVYADDLPVKERFGLEAGMGTAEAFALFENDDRILEFEQDGLGVTFRTATVEYKITFHDGGVQFYRITAGDFDYDYDALYAAVTGFPGTETGRLMAELTGDKKPELVVVSKRNEDGLDRGYITVYTVNDGEVQQLWQTYTSTVHAEARTYYLYNDGNRDYILDAVYYLNQGQINYNYEIYGFTNYGAQQTFWRGKLEGNYEKLQDLIPDFIDEVNSYTANSTLLLDGQSYDLYVYGAYGTQGEGDELEIILTGDFTEVNGGLKAKAYTVKYVYLTDSELRSLKPGDVVDLTYAGYGTITVDKVEIDGNYAEIEEYGDHLYRYQDGNWYFEYPSDVPYTYEGGLVEVFFPKGLEITDWSSGNGMSPDIRDDVRDIPSWAYGNGMTVTVKDGTVTSATLNFRP